jgi:hypothetical protein
MKVTENVVKVDLVIESEFPQTGENLIQLIEENNLEQHNIAVDEDDSDVLVFIKFD